MSRTKLNAVESHGRPPFSRMIRKIVIGVLALLVACVLAAVFFFDAIASRVISTAGTHILGVTTTVQSTHLGLFDGKSSLSGLKIAEPAGFGEGSMLSVDSATVTAGLSELMSQDVVLEMIEITGVTIHLVEVNNKVNLEVVAANVTGSDKTPDPAAKSTGSVTIRQLKVTNIKVLVTSDLTLTGRKPIEVTIPDIVVTDLGTKTPRNDVAAQIATQLMSRLLVAIVQAQIEGLPQNMMSGLQNASSSLSSAATSLLNTSGDAIQKTIDGAGDAIKSIFGDK